MTPGDLIGLASVCNQHRAYDFGGDPAL
jgi:hypothetical protein